MNKYTGSNLLALATTLLMVLGGCSKPQDGATAVANVPDIDVTQHVKAALHQNMSLSRFDITVVTRKGDVRLIGALDSQSQIDEAIKIARASGGAHTIHDELTIKK